MNTFRIALANIRFPASPDESVALAEQAVAQASIEGAGLICFPECFVPGYRVGKSVAPPDPAFLECAWSAISAAAAKANVAVVLGTERIINNALRATALVVNRDGTPLVSKTRFSSTLRRKAPIPSALEGAFSRPTRSHLASRSAMKAGAIRKPSVGPCDAAPKSFSIPISTKRSPPVTCPRLSPIRRTPSTKKQSCAAPPRILATSPP